MADPSKSFTFPLDDRFLTSLQTKLTSLRLSQDPRLCVISLIGQGRLSRCHSKGSLISGVIGREAFRDIPLPHYRNNNNNNNNNNSSSDGKTGNIMIRGHVNLDQRVVYLHLVSIRDATVLSRLCSSFLSRHRSKETSNEDANDVDRETFHSFMAEAEFEAARALLFLFSISHLILVNNPGSRFDLGLVRLFRNLETIRQKLQPSMTEVLRTVSGISKEWMYAGRPCSPRMLFVFEKNPLGGGGDTASNAQASAPPSIYGGNTNNNNNNNNNRNPSEDHENLQRGGGVSSDAIKRLQHNMEDQIYRILRKARIITNISNNSLFAVPANEEFVYVMNKGEEDAIESLVSDQASSETIDDPIAFLMRKLTASCVIGGADSSASSKASKSSASLSSAGSNQTWSSVSMAASSSSASSVGAAAATSKVSHSAKPTPFKAFVQRHIDQALAKGFDDNLGRNPPPALFELPRCGVWFEAAAVLYDYILGESGGGSSSVVVSARAANCISNLKTLIDVDAKFSEARCSKVVPLAIAAYQEGILNHYTRSFHNKRVNDAVNSFDSHARGPAYGTFLQQVKDECDAIWQEGRQSCEATTLTGNHCIHALHRLPSDAAAAASSDATASDLPTKPHQTLNKTLSASNCGTRQASREDPFDIKAANYSFYESLDEGIYDRYNFSLKQETPIPVEEPTVERKVSGASLSKDGAGGLSASSRGLGDHPSIDGGAGGAAGGGGGASVSSRGVGDVTSLDGGGSGLGSLGLPKGGGGKYVSASTGTAEEKSISFVGSEAEEKIFEEDDKEDESRVIEGIEEILVGGSEGGFDDDVDFEEVDKTSKASVGIASSDPPVARKTSKDSTTAFNATVEPSTSKQQVILKGMLTTTSPSGSSVEFSSWCLTRIGNAGSYNSGKGLDQPGFLSGSNFLLPWDIQIGEKGSGISAVIPLKGKSTKGYLRQKKTLLSTPNSKESASENSLIRAYVGYEYECPRGHRFISSAPESADNSGSSLNASPVERLIAADMPLYTLCPCRDRSQKVFIAQLMRIFIVTPDRLSSSSSSSSSPSFKLFLSPRVQPAASPAPIFYPGGALQPFSLEPNCLWVLRLPNIYMDEEKVYSQPKDVTLFPSCRVLKGLVSLSKGPESVVTK